MGAGVMRLPVGASYGEWPMSADSLGSGTRGGHGVRAQPGQRPARLGIVDNLPGKFATLLQRSPRVAAGRIRLQAHPLIGEPPDRIKQCRRQPTLHEFIRAPACFGAFDVEVLVQANSERIQERMHGRAGLDVAGAGHPDRMNGSALLIKEDRLASLVFTDNKKQWHLQRRPHQFSMQTRYGAMVGRIHRNQPQVSAKPPRSAPWLLSTCITRGPSATPSKAIDTVR